MHNHIPNANHNDMHNYVHNDIHNDMHNSMHNHMLKLNMPMIAQLQKEKCP
jgi:hypothetical protein